MPSAAREFRRRKRISAGMIAEAASILFALTVTASEVSGSSGYTITSTQGTGLVLSETGPLASKISAERSGGFSAPALSGETSRLIAFHFLSRFFVRSEPGASDSFAKRVEELIAAGRLGDARAKLEDEAARRGKTHKVYYLEARILFAEQRYVESLKTLERCLALQEQDPEVYILVALNAVRIDRMDVAEMALKRAIALAPSDFVPHFHLGALYYTESRFPLAEPELRAAVALKPDNVPAHLFLGLTLEELEGEQAAMDCYREAISLVEKQRLKIELPYLYLGRLYLRLNRLAESLPFLRKAAQVNPQSSEALFLLGKVLNFMGQETEAVSVLHEAAKADDTYPDPHYLLSRIYLKQGHAQEAQREFIIFQKLKEAETGRADHRKGQRKVEEGSR